ncbi:MAG: cellulase family glycosylhydrolase [Spirochaetes bacterium]|nr:cellulase family glycosylhydrolase [Spirochaetota bacterium]
MAYLSWLDNTPVGPVPAPCPALPYAAPAPADAPLAAEGDYFKDDQGRVVILRGVNVAGNSKVPPFTPITSEMLDPLPGWGFNTIRLLFTWEAFEPTRCSFENSYLDYYEKVVQWARAQNIYVMVDFHQDGYSRYSVSGCGEGFPSWAVTPAVALKTPDNGAACASWGIMMVIDAMHQKTWKDFHLDLYGTRTRYLEMVEAVADKMSQYDNVIGYELINEPWGTDAQLSAFYELVAARIRGRHPSAILFVPPSAIVSSGMVANTMSKPGFGNFSYSPHNYDGFVTLFKSWQGGSPAPALNALRDKAVAWQVPLVLSEFGAPATITNIAGYMEAQYDWLDDHFASAIQWCYTPGWRSDIKDGWNMEDFSIVDDAGQLRASCVPRPYPQKIAGTPGLFTRTDSGFTMTWTHTLSGVATEIFLPEHYADDKTLTYALPSGATGSCSISGQKLSCTVNGTGNVQVELAR